MLDVGFCVHTLSLPATTVLDLVPREVGGVLLELGLIPESAIGASNPHSKHLAKTLLNCGGVVMGNMMGWHCDCNSATLQFRAYLR
jgi:hypothetical protein